MYFIIILLGLLFLGIPVSFSIGLSSFLFLIIEGSFSFLDVIPQTLFTGLDSFPYLAIPTFILAGELMNKTGITDDLIKLADTLVGHFTGGLAQVNVLASVFFAGLTGAAVSDTSALGSVEIPMMVKGGYSKAFSAAVTAASSIIGPIIPPSIIMVIYAMVAMNVSVGAMFIAGILPGLLLGLSMMILIYFISKKRGYHVKEKRASVKEIAIAFRKAIVPLFMPIIIIGGIVLGIFTATEAAVIAVGYAFVVGFFYYKSLSFSKLPAIFKKSAVTTSVVGLLIAFAKVMGWILTTTQISQSFGSYLVSHISSPSVFLFAAAIIFLILGFFFDPSAALILSVPILLPVAMQFGINPLHFGILTIVALNIGLITPPVGVCLFVACSVANIKLEELIPEILPFIGVSILVLFLIIFISQITLLLPKLFGLI